MTKKRYVIVGTGGRAISFISPMLSQYRAHCELVGLCDISLIRIEHYNQLLARDFAHPRVAAYNASQFEQMLREQRPDCVVVTSKDSTHHEYIIGALRHGCEVVTEKPMTIDAPKCRAVLDAVRETGRRMTVALNYRWVPLHTKLKELITAGTIGQVKSVNMEYLLDTRHGADYYHRWHSEMAQSGGLLVHKSTHHFDLVNWWLDAIPSQVFAYGQLDFYGKTNAVARGDDTLTRYPRYTDEPASVGDPFRIGLRDGKSLESLYLMAETETGYLRDRNVFRDGIDIFDNMCALVRYRSGQLLTYSLVSFSPREGMRVTFNGERGRIELYEFGRTHIIRGQNDEELAREQSAGDNVIESIRVYPHFKPSYDVPLPAANGGHGGADPLLAEQLFSPAAPKDSCHHRAGAEQGAAAILVGIAANQSIAANRVVNLNDLVTLAPRATKLSELDGAPSPLERVT